MLIYESKKVEKLFIIYLKVQWDNFYINLQFQGTSMHAENYLNKVRYSQI